jgi:hypothetical protein
MKRIINEGSSFESFLDEEGILDEVDEAAVKRVIAWQVEREMTARKLNKSQLARRMDTSRRSTASSIRTTPASRFIRCTGPPKSWANACVSASRRPMAQRDNSKSKGTRLELRLPGRTVAPRHCRARFRHGGAMRIVIPGVALLAAMIASLPTEAQDSVSLSFAWPAPIHARVAATLQRKSHWVEMNLDKTETLSGTFETNVDRSPDGQIHVRFGKPELAVATGKAGKATLTIMELIPLLPLAFGPTIAISRDATVFRVEDPADFRSALVALVENSITDEKIREFIPRMVAGHASDEQLDGISKMRWGGIVGLWNGRTLRQGEVTHWAERLTVATAGEPTLVYQYQAEFVGRVACSAGESAMPCVELHLIAEVAAPDRQAYAEQVQRSAKGGVRFEYPEMRVEVRLVTDPDTLLPHRFHESTRGGMKMIEENSTMEQHRQDDLQLIFTY